jgi:hypothetical protein
MTQTIHHATVAQQVHQRQHQAARGPARGLATGLVLSTILWPTALVLWLQFGA